MKFSIKTILLVGALWFSVNLNAQDYKFGYINSADLLAEMPATKSAETQLETFTKKLEEQYQAKVQSYQSKYQYLEQNYQTIPPATLAEEQRKLQEMEGELRKFDYESQQKVAQKRAELLQPILDQAQNAIEQVAQENGYSYIFDLSTGTLLFQPPGDDVLGLVKSKLGM